MLAYLVDDVKAGWELLEQFGNKTWNNNKINIVDTHTIGSLTTKIWRTKLPEPVPKILNTISYSEWKDCNKGGYSGPIEKLYQKIYQKLLILHMIKFKK